MYPIYKPDLTSQLQMNRLRLLTESFVHISIVVQNLQNPLFFLLPSLRSRPPKEGLATPLGIETHNLRNCALD